LWYFSVIFCEAVAIYGVIVAIILQTKLESVPKASIYEPESLRAGYAIFASGLIVGFANLVCGCVLFYLHLISSQEFIHPIVCIQLFFVLVGCV
jgi:F0F1-type ATP synthase membrane subunit c/vacuolar-type H+-ATPase subunit K